MIDIHKEINAIFAGALKAAIRREIAKADDLAKWREQERMRRDLEPVEFIDEHTNERADRERLREAQRAEWREGGML